MADYSTLPEFLSVETHMAFHPTTIPDSAQSLDFVADVNGVVLELARAGGLRAELLPRLRFLLPHYVWTHHWTLRLA